jgi:hypothetical protein
MQPREIPARTAKKYIKRAAHCILNEKDNIVKGKASLFDVGGTYKLWKHTKKRKKE